MPKRVEKDEAYYRRLFILGTGLEAGNTVKESAEAAGISERHAYDILNKEELALNTFRAGVKALVKLNMREVREIAREKADAEFESKLGKAFAALDSALDAADPKTALEAAKETFNRLFGKSAATLNVTGGLKNQNTFSLDPETLKVLSGLTKQSAQLYKGAKRIEGSVIDVTPS